MVDVRLVQRVMRHRDKRRHDRRERRLVYCYYRCHCGALFAYDPGQRPRPTAWDCSAVILGDAPAAGQKHDAVMPFVFWKVKEAPTGWALKHRVEHDG